MKTILIITASAEGRSRSWHTSTTPLPRTRLWLARLCDLRDRPEAQEVVKRNETPSASLRQARG
jgi:hypothetical protein